MWQVVTEAFVGTDRFTMLADDGVDQTQFDVVVTVTESLDTIPDCASMRSAVVAGDSVTIQLQCFDRDGDVPQLEVREAPAPGTGTLEPVAQQAQTVRFTADPSFTGTARFVYGATDPSGPSAPATVEIDVRDGTPPVLKLAPAGRQPRSSVLANGVAVVVQLDEPAAVSVQALVAAKAARRLGIARRAKKPVVIGRSARSVAAGRTTLRVRLNRRARRALRRSKKATTIRIAATATDAAGNRRALPGRVVVR